MFLNLHFKREDREENTGCCEASVIWCLVHVGFRNKHGRLEDSVLDECGEMENEHAEGMAVFAQELLGPQLECRKILNFKYSDRGKHPPPAPETCAGGPHAASGGEATI